MIWIVVVAPLVIIVGAVAAAWVTWGLDRPVAPHEVLGPESLEHTRLATVGLSGAVDRFGRHDADGRRRPHDR